MHAWVRQSVEKQEALEQIELPGPGGTGRGDVVEEMLKQTLKKRKKKKRTSRKPLGVEGVFNKAFTDRPECPKRSRRPAAYGDRESVRAYIEDKAELTQHYEWASERFRAGEQDVEFPPGTYPPDAPVHEQAAGRRSVARSPAIESPRDRNPQDKLRRTGAPTRRDRARPEG